MTLTFDRETELLRSIFGIPFEARFALNNDDTRQGKGNDIRWQIHSEDTGLPGATARSKRVKVSNRKGIANQSVPESFVAHREVRDEALTGEPAGQPSSRESFKLVQGADAVSVVEGNTDRRDRASACSTLRGLRPWHVGTLFAREPGDLLLGRLSSFRAVRIGKTRSRSR